MKKSHATRFLSLLLALVLSVSLCPPALADWVDFSDVSPSHWAYDSIMYCSEWNIVTGYEDGRFLPENQVTRAQFISMLTRAFYSGEVEAAQQSKPAGTPWYWAHAKVADDVGMTKNLSAVDGSAMNRYEMAAALNNVIDETSVVLLVTTALNAQYIQGKLKEPPSFNWIAQQMKAAQQSIKDWDRVPSQYRDAVAQCYALGALTGMSDGTFSGEQSMTRAQACIVITRMVDLTQGKPPAAPSQPQQPETPAQSGTGLLANGQEATVENVQAILDQIQREYPTGTIWGYDYTPNTNYYKDGDKLSDARTLIMTWANTTYGCGGWATMVSNRIFGMTGAPAREVNSLDEARPGDIVLKFDGNGKIGHVAIFYKKADNAPYVVDGMTFYPNTVVDKNGVEHHDCFYYTCDGNVGSPSYPNTRVVDWASVTRSALEIGPGCYTRIFTRYPA